MKILLADDDRDQLSVRGLLLVHNGFRALEASDRDSALRMAEAEHPECAVVDLRFPTEDVGLDLIRRLKAIDHHMRIVVLTGGDPAKLFGRIERGLIDEVIQKGSPAPLLMNSLKAFEASRREGFPGEARDDA